MSAASSLISALMILSLLGFAGSLSAGPVQADASERADEAAATLAPASERSVADSQASPLLASPMTPSSAPQTDATPSASALAAEIIKEAEAGAQATEQPRSTQRANVQAVSQTVPAKSSARTQTGADADPWGLREAGKAAVHWIKDTVPWLRSDEDDSSADKASALDTADWSASPLDGSASGRGAPAGSTHLTGAVRTGPSDPNLTVGYSTTAARAATDPDQNIVRQLIAVIREVLEHPMTWLVVSLFVIGGIAVKRMDRRPTK